MLARKTIQNLPNNSRFYVLIISALISLFILSLLRVQITNDQLFVIRTGQAYGFISIVYLYVALIISPLKRLVGGHRRWMQNLEFSRRAIGVSAAYFALLHAGIGLWGQIGGLDGLALLPERFIWSLSLGAGALLVLLLMASTSFDAVIKFMTFRKWKWLHRFVYIGCVFIIVHVWMIGTHMAHDWVRVATFIPLSVLFALEAWTIVGKMSEQWPVFKARDHFVTLVVSIWITLSALLFMLPALVKNYHSEHHSEADTSQHEGGKHE